MEQPLVSIVTPSYEQGDFIEDTLRSVSAQEYERIEHIVVDGGSSDGTIDTLEDYEDEYDLRWVSEPDDGQSDALNKGFEMADGDIVGWINSDDLYYQRNVVRTAVKRFTAESSLDVLYGSIAFIDARSNITRSQPAASFDAVALKGHNYIPQPGVFFDSRVVAENELRTELTFAMDYEYWLRLAAAGYTFSRTSEVMAGYRMHDAAKGPSIGRAKLDKERQALREEYGTAPQLQEALFKVTRNVREFLWNVRTRSRRGQKPPVLSQGES